MWYTHNVWYVKFSSPWSQKRFHSNFNPLIETLKPSNEFWTTLIFNPHVMRVVSIKIVWISWSIGYLNLPIQAGEFYRLDFLKTIIHTMQFNWKDGYWFSKKNKLFFRNEILGLCPEHEYKRTQVFLQIKRMC
jgi:hypothetical protein